MSNDLRGVMRRPGRKQKCVFV